MRARKSQNSRSSTVTRGNIIHASGAQFPKPNAAKSDVFSVRRLLLFSEIEEWRRDDPHISSGYRPVSGSVRRSLSSLSYLHNESVNIYTHMIGFVAVPPIWYYVKNFVMSRYSTISQADSMVISAFFVTAAGCMGASTAFHTLLNHSERVARASLFIDFLGILCFIIGSFYTGVYYGFYCETTEMYSYLSMITILGSASIITCVVPSFRQRKYRTQRTLLFCAVGASGFLPLTHAILQHGAKKALWNMGAMWYLIEAIFYIIGALLYGARIPESLKPGAFDIWFHAHQIMHVCVLLGAMSHLRGILIGLDYNHNPETRQCYS